MPLGVIGHYNQEIAKDDILPFRPIGRPNIMDITLDPRWQPALDHSRYLTTLLNARPGRKNEPAGPA